MKKILLVATALITSFSLSAADAKDDVTAAAKKLGEAENYSWKTTVQVPADSQFKPGPTEGKASKDGTIYVTMSFGDNVTEAVKKGDKGAVTNQDGDWQSIADVEKEEGFGRFRAMMIKNYKTPSEQAVDLAGAAKDLKKDGDVITGELTPEGAKQFLSMRRGGNGPTASDAKGTVKFWVKDGTLSKYEFHVTGKINFNGEDRAVDRTTTTEISKVGETKVVVPEGAKKKLS